MLAIPSIPPCPFSLSTFSRAGPESPEHHTHCGPFVSESCARESLQPAARQRCIQCTSHVHVPGIHIEGRAGRQTLAQIIQPLGEDLHYCRPVLDAPHFSGGGDGRTRTRRCQARCHTSTRRKHYHRITSGCTSQRRLQPPGKAHVAYPLMCSYSPLLACRPGGTWSLSARPCKAGWISRSQEPSSGFRIKPCTPYDTDSYHELCPLSVWTGCGTLVTDSTTRCSLTIATDSNSVNPLIDWRGSRRKVSPHTREVCR